MFKAVKKIRGDCDGSASHTARGVYLVEDLLTKQVLKLCLKCFDQQMELRSKGQKAEDDGPAMAVPVGR